MEIITHRIADYPSWENNDNHFTMVIAEISCDEETYQVSEYIHLTEDGWVVDKTADSNLSFHGHAILERIEEDELAVFLEGCLDEYDALYWEIGKDNAESHYVFGSRYEAFRYISKNDLKDYWIKCIGREWPEMIGVSINACIDLRGKY